MRVEHQLYDSLINEFSEVISGNFARMTLLVVLTIVLLRVTLSVHCSPIDSPVGLHGLYSCLLGSENTDGSKEDRTVFRHVGLCQKHPFKGRNGCLLQRLHPQHARNHSVCWY